MIPHFLDTHILLYSTGRNPAGSHRPLEPLGRIEYRTSPSASPTLGRGSASRKWIPPYCAPLYSHNLSSRNSAVLAAALELGCERVYTEDLNHGQVLGGLTILNPFA